MENVPLINKNAENGSDVGITINKIDGAVDGEQDDNAHPLQLQCIGCQLSLYNNLMNDTDFLSYFPCCKDTKKKVIKEIFYVKNA